MNAGVFVPGRLIVVSFDPGSTTGWAWHSAAKNSLLRKGIQETLREMRKDVNVYELDPLVQDMDLGYETDQFSYEDEDVMVDRMVDNIHQAIRAYEYDIAVDTFAIVSESFNLRVFSENTSLLAPVRINAKLERDLRRMRLRLHQQTPSDAKRVVSDQRLKHWNIYHPGSVHARDAQRHGILFMRRWGSQLALRTAVGTGMPKREASKESGVA